MITLSSPINTIQPSITLFSGYYLEDKEYSLQDASSPTAQPQLLQFFTLCSHSCSFSSPQKALIFPLCSVRSIPLPTSSSTPTIASSTFVSLFQHPTSEQPLQSHGSPFLSIFVSSNFMPMVEGPLPVLIFLFYLSISEN